MRIKYIATLFLLCSCSARTNHSCIDKFPYFDKDQLPKIGTFLSDPTWPEFILSESARRYFRDGFEIAVSEGINSYSTYDTFKLQSDEELNFQRGYDFAKSLMMLVRNARFEEYKKLIEAMASN